MTDLSVVPPIQWASGNVQRRELAQIDTASSENTARCIRLRNPSRFLHFRRRFRRQTVSPCFTGNPSRDLRGFPRRLQQCRNDVTRIHKRSTTWTKYARLESEMHVDTRATTRNDN